jgi:hypothetical protein
MRNYYALLAIGFPLLVLAAALAIDKILKRFYEVTDEADRKTLAQILSHDGKAKE